MKAPIILSGFMVRVAMRTVHAAKEQLHRMEQHNRRAEVRKV